MNLGSFKQQWTKSVNLFLFWGGVILGPLKFAPKQNPGATGLSRSNFQKSLNYSATLCQSRSCQRNVFNLSELRGGSGI